VIGEVTGGTIILTHVVENYPGFIALSGPELAEKIENHAKDYDVDMLTARVQKIEMHNQGGKRHYKTFTNDNKFKVFKTKTIILCTGTRVKRLNVPGEKEYENKGVHYCALCDGPFYKSKVIGVVGGSDSAAKEALLLAEYGKKVYIIYRGEKIRPEPINMSRVESLKKKGKIEIIKNTNVTEIKGVQFMNKVILDKPYKNSREFKLDAIFVEIGHIPLSELVIPLGVKLNDKSEVIINRKSQTNVQGVFAAGDVVDTEFKQAITGVGEGVAAVYQAYKYVKEGEFVRPTGENKPEKISIKQNKMVDVSHIARKIVVKAKQKRQMR